MRLEPARNSKSRKPIPAPTTAPKKANMGTQPPPPPSTQTATAAIAAPSNGTATTVPRSDRTHHRRPSAFLTSTVAATASWSFSVSPCRLARLAVCVGVSFTTARSGIGSLTFTRRRETRWPSGVPSGRRALRAARCGCRNPATVGHSLELVAD